MRYTEFTITAALVALASGCASTVQHGPKVRSIDYEEAAAFERTLVAKEASTPSKPMPLFIQPVNKKEPCKLPTSQEQLARNNFRAYWDGQCKNGYASGLGRDIAISDTHHYEEITIHNGTGDNSSSPSALYDYVNNRVIYRVIYNVPGEKYPAASWLIEEISNTDTNFHVSYSFGVTDELGNRLLTQYSPFSPSRLFINDRRNIVYRFADASAMPVIDASTITFSADILDPKTMTPGGVAIVRYGTGQVRHLKLNGASPEAVALPTEYLNDWNEKYKAIQNALVRARSEIVRAQQMEREYLYMACNGKHTISGLDNETATKICKWRGQFKEQYEKTLAKYTQNMEQLQQKAESARQQRLAQQQIDVQRRQLQQQQTQQWLQQFANTLGQMGQQMQNSGQQMLNSVMNQPMPQVNFAPFTPQGGNQVRCIHTGPVTNCRY